MYQLTHHSSVIRLSDTACIPEGSIEYGEFEQWVAEGNVPLPPAVPIPTPEEVRLVEIDDAAKLTPRAFRELVMLVAEGFKMATGGALDLKAMVPGVAQVFDLEEEAATLRSQLNK